MLVYMIGSPDVLDSPRLRCVCVCFSPWCSGLPYRLRCVSVCLCVCVCVCFSLCGVEACRLASDVCVRNYESKQKGGVCVTQREKTFKSAVLNRKMPL